MKKSSRARNRKILHLARVTEGFPEPTAEPSVGSGLSGRAPQVGTSSGRQPVGTDPRIDQLVSAQGDLLTHMQNMTAMMGRFVNSVIPAPTRKTYPDKNRFNDPGNCLTPTLVKAGKAFNPMQGGGMG